MNAGLEARLKHLTLDDAIDIAVHRNPDILRQLQEIQRTQGVVVEVRAQLLPHLILTGTFQQEDQKLLEGGRGGSTGSSSTGTGTTGTGVGTGTGTGNGTTGTTTGSSPSCAGRSRHRPRRRPGRFSKALRAPLAAAVRRPTGIQRHHRSPANLVQRRRFAADPSGALHPRQCLLTTARDGGHHVNNVKTQFYTVLLDEALIKIQEETIRLLESQLRDQQNRFAAGTVPRFDVLQANVAVSNQRPAAHHARNNITTWVTSVSPAVSAWSTAPTRSESHPSK